MADRVRQNRVLELPEIISGILVLGVVLWEACFEPKAEDAVTLALFNEGIHLILCGLVYFNTLSVLTNVVGNLIYRLTHKTTGEAAVPVRRAARVGWALGLVRRRLVHPAKNAAPLPALLWQLAVGLAASFVFSGGVWDFLPVHAYWVSLFLGLMMGVFSIVNMVIYRRERRRSLQQGRRTKWSPAVVFFTMMVSFVLLSTLVLLTPGASLKPISMVDALFTCASATSITGLTCIDIASTLSPLGKLVVLADIQVGAMGVMTFTYSVLLMLGKRLTTQDSVAMSSILDQEGAIKTSELLKGLLVVTFSVEAIGAALLYWLWYGTPEIAPQHLWFYAIFHAVSAFCNAGITLFRNNMAQDFVAHSYSVQAVMMGLILAGTLGFGVYLEFLRRLRDRFTGQKPPRRWGTNTWFVVRVMGMVMLLGFVGLSLLSLCEPSAHAAQSVPQALWESLWNTIGRSAGFNLSDIDTYGPVYHFFMCVLMFVGGNPAGTGGGVFAPVVALCVLEVLRVLRGQQDVQMHGRRIARGTVERAMATVVLSIFWITASTMTLMLLEPTLTTQSGNGLLRMLYLEISAYTTTGFTIVSPAELSIYSKLLLTVTMLFGRLGMFTFMFLFIKPKPPQPFRFPETRLSLN